jgi:hypothetical protein
MAKNSTILLYATPEKLQEAILRLGPPDSGAEDRPFCAGERFWLNEVGTYGIVKDNMLNMGG